MGNDQKPKSLSSLVIKTNNFKIWHSSYMLGGILKYSYSFSCFLTPQFQNFTNLPHGNLEIGRNYQSILITIISILLC